MQPADIASNDRAIGRRAAGMATRTVRTGQSPMAFFRDEIHRRRYSPFLDDFWTSVDNRQPITDETTRSAAATDRREDRPPRSAIARPRLISRDPHCDSAKTIGSDGLLRQISNQVCIPGQRISTSQVRRPARKSSNSVQLPRHSLSSSTYSIVR
jgi:hypothetical protein